MRKKGAVIMKESLVDPALGQSLIEAATSPDFAEILLGAARRLDSIEEVFAYQVDASGRVRVILAAGERRGIAERTGEYAKRFHAMDPVLLARAYRGKRGGFARQVRASDIPSGEYRELCYAQPGFIDKLSFAWSGASQSMLVLSFYRGLNALSSSPNPQLSALGQMAMAALHTQVHSPAAIALHHGDAEAVLLARLGRSFPSLTERERLIVARTLLGDSANEIGAALSISPATVHTYRLRAYDRYRLRRASDFLRSLLS